MILSTLALGLGAFAFVREAIQHGASRWFGGFADARNDERPDQQQSEPFQRGPPVLLLTAILAGHDAQLPLAVEPRGQLREHACALLVAWSRCVLGVHYPTDVLAGAVVGTIVGVAFAREAMRRRKAPDPKKEARRAGET